MMKLLSSLLPSIAILSCFSADVSVHAKTIEGDVQLQLLVGLETRLDHSEMNRIFSTPNHRRHLKADKLALAEKSKAHIGTCLQLYHLSIDDHNNSKKGGGGLEIIPLAKDGSRFYLSGSVKDFVSYFNKGGGNGSFFISFKETLNENNQVTITANYEDGQTAKKFSEELEECTGFIGTFHRRRNHNIDQVEIGRNGESENENESRVLQRILSTEELSGFCPLSTEAIKKFLEENPTGKKGFPPANAETIRNMYGVPSLDGTCYKPRDSAVYSEGVRIGVDDLTCYNQINGLQNTVVEPVSIDNKDLFSPPFGSPFGPDTPNGICKLPKCVCASHHVTGLAQTDAQKKTLNGLPGICLEPNIDVQMISAVSGGTTIRSLSYYNNDPASMLLSTYEDLLIQLTKLEEDEHPPAVISISYGACYDPSTFPENEKQLVEICKHIGMVTMNTGITFFVASGDGGATQEKVYGVCGVYCQNALSACPYVTSVGGSFGSEGGTEVLSIGEPAGNHPQGTNVVSGGGFSKIFSVANGFDLSYQAAAVKSWRQQPNATLSLPGYENADGSVGAGFPDVSAKSDNIEIFIGLFPVTITGTSASSPMLAGIVNLCASQLDDDQAGFGWINPYLYQNPDLFFDIIGDNNSNDQNGVSCPPPPVNEICPPANFIAKAYLTYDGSLGETVFVDIQTTGTSFVSRTVAKDESIAFGFDVTTTDSAAIPPTLDNFKDVSIIVSDLDPDQGGSTIISKTMSTSCPGSWTIGSTIVSGFVLNGFLNYDLDLPFTPVANVEANGKFFGFEATDGWDPASGLGTIGTVDQNDPNKGFRGLCKVLLGKPFDFEKIQCTIPTAAPTKKKVKKSKKKNSKKSF